MHVRLSTVLGLPIVDDATEEVVGTLASVCVHPDQGTIEGLFVRTNGHLLLVSALDVLHWGAHIRIRDADALAPLAEHIRFAQWAQEGRTLLRQRMVTQEGVQLGTCKDVQFNTKTFALEWLFPRGWFRWKSAVPASAIVEVTREAIIVRDLVVPVETEKVPVLQTIEELTKTPTVD